MFDSSSGGGEGECQGAPRRLALAQQGLAQLLPSTCACKHARLHGAPHLGAGVVQACLLDVVFLCPERASGVTRALGSSAVSEGDVWLETGFGLVIPVRSEDADPGCLWMGEGEEAGAGC